MHADRPDPNVQVVGIGADGWGGLGERARAAVRGARAVYGSERQLALLPADVKAERRAWPSPLSPALDEIVAAEEPVCVLASGDPMLHGIGATLARRMDPERLDIHPHPSAFAYACARLAWPQTEVELVSAVGRPPDVVARALTPGRRLIVYATGTEGAIGIARALIDRGFGPSRFVVFEQLGAPAERRIESTAATWGERTTDPLFAIAIECHMEPGAMPLPRTPGLPDAAYEHDGMLTKRTVRAVTLAALAPAPRQLLWDVGAGSGSIGIEWLRAEPNARAIAIEANPERAARASANATRLGVPHLDVVEGKAPEALNGLDRPDAIFVGGGIARSDLLARCWDALPAGGRIVANAVTIEAEQVLVAARATHGGDLVRLAVSHAEPLGGLTTWRSALPIVQWSATKPEVHA